jgi:hypothetical protein
VDGARLETMYGLTNGRAQPPTALEESALQSLSISPGNSSNWGSSSSRRRPTRATADVFVPVPTSDPAGLARKAVAAGATLEGVGATGAQQQHQQQHQHILVRPPGGALVLVLTSQSSSPPPPPQQPEQQPKQGKKKGGGSPPVPEPTATTAPTAAATNKAEEQEVGLAEGEAGIGTYFPTLRIEHRCCKDAGEVYANTPRPIPYVVGSFVGFLNRLFDHQLTDRNYAHHT